MIYANTVLLLMKCQALIDADAHMSSWGHVNGLFLPLSLSGDNLPQCFDVIAFGPKKDIS